MVILVTGLLADQQTLKAALLVELARAGLHNDVQVFGIDEAIPGFHALTHGKTVTMAMSGRILILANDEKLTSLAYQVETADDAASLAVALLQTSTRRFQPAVLPRLGPLVLPHGPITHNPSGGN